MKEIYKKIFGVMFVVVVLIGGAVGAHVFNSNDKVENTKVTIND